MKSVADWLTAFAGLAFFVLTLNGLYSRQDLSQTQERTDHQMCEEVSQELLIQAEMGMISAEQAQVISDRCFRTFAH